MDYGPTLTGTFEVGDDGTNFAYKGVAVRLDAGPGGISRGRHWVVYDHDTMRLAAAWTGEGFIDWNGINFNGQHGIHPRIAGLVEGRQPERAGLGQPARRLVRRPSAARPRRPPARPPAPVVGPLPGPVSPRRPRHPGLHGRRDPGPGDAGARRLAGLARLHSDDPPRAEAEGPGPAGRPTAGRLALPAQARVEGRRRERSSSRSQASRRALACPCPSSSDGETRIEVEKPEDFDLTGADYTIAARFQTRRGGTLFAEAPAGEVWAPDGKSLFVRNGRLVFDIGWVGAVESRRTVADGRWHDAVATFEHDDGPGPPLHRRPGRPRGGAQASQGRSPPDRSGSASRRPISRSRRPISTARSPRSASTGRPSRPPRRLACSKRMRRPIGWSLAGSRTARRGSSCPTRRARAIAARCSGGSGRRRPRGRSSPRSRPGFPAASGSRHPMATSV